MSKKADDFFKNLLGKTVDTAVNAGIQTLITGQDYEDAFKQQAGLAALTAISGKGSPLDFFKQQQQQPTAPPQNVTVSAGTPPAKIQRRTVPRPLTPEEKQQVEFLSVMKGMSEEEAKADLFPSLFPTEVKDVNVTDIDNRGIMESLGDVVTGDGGRMSALKQLFFPDPAGNPDKLRQYGPLGALATYLAYKDGFFDPEPGLPGPYGGIGNIDLQAKYPGTYRPGVPQIARPAAMADGGFPRKTGAIAGPGTETSDDIPAMLSDGEFVMTAQAVRGAGNGDRETGIRRMYDIMNGFERSVA
jgi:hypothetical protein